METEKYLLLKDPLTEISRKARKSLLGLSTLGILMVEMGLYPSKFSAFGIEFAKTNQQSLLTLMALVVSYFLLSFLIYSASDFLIWKKTIKDSLIDLAIEHFDKQKTLENLVTPKLKEMLEEVSSDGIRYSLFSKPVSVVRALFEFFLPIVYGCYAVFVLFTTKV